MNKPDSSRLEQEIAAHRRAVRASPRNAQAHALLGMALQKHGQYANAVDSQRRALALDPKLVALYGVMAAAQFATGDHAGAADSYRRALLHSPGDADLQRGLAESLRLAGQQEAALASARRALELAPDDLEALLVLAQTQYVAEQFEAAAASFRQVTERAPDHVGAWIDRGRAATRARSFDDAAASFGRALDLNPDDPAVLCDLGVALQSSERHEEARAAFERSLERDPERAATLAGLTHNYFGAGRWEDALRLVRRHMEIAPSPSVHSTLVFILSHATLDADELTREHFAYGERWEAPLRAAWPAHANGRDPGRRIRVGFVSADLRHHAVTRFVEPVFGMLRHSDQLEFYVYSNSLEEDTITQRLRAYMPNWRSIARADDAEAERMIRLDAIDILVDLSGHSAQNRLPLFARKPAPVQASWIGYAGTTGLKAMDYYLSDQFHLPEGRYDEQFSEAIVRLPLSAPFLPPGDAPEVNPLPAATNGHITFGSFHRASKISRATVALWAKLLRGTPDSRLLLGGQHGGSEALLLGWFDEEGIDRARILVRPRVPIHAYLRQHHEVDVCLSPFPYSGSTTICYALWMGIPTLVTVGPTNPSHSAVCYLAHLGLSSFLAHDDASFVALGRFLEENTGTLAALRGAMRERFRQSVVGYPGVAAASLELALRRMWQRWCAGEAAGPLRVRLSELADGEEEPA